MSAVSSEAPQSADLSEAKPSPAAGAGESAPHEHSGDGGASKDFGPNEWLVDELYQRYLADPGSVDMAWWNFFADYSPPAGSGAARAAEQQGLPTAPSGAAAPGPDSGSGTNGSTDGQPPRDRGPRGAATAQDGPAVQASAPAAAPAAAPQRPAAPPAPGTPPGTGSSSTGSSSTGSSSTGSSSTGSSSTGSSSTGSSSTGSSSTGSSSTGPAASATPASRLRGAAARTAVNMAASLSVPTATSVRSVPAKLLIDNRIVINNHLARGRGGKVSFTHLIGFAVVKALGAVPAMNESYTELDGKPAIVEPEHVHLGLAIDVAGKDGSRQLLVPAVKAAEAMDFRQFWMAYEDVVRRARGGKLTVDDYAGTTISLTNPGTIGTEHSVPRLMAGQGCIVGVGAMEYPAAYQGAAEETMTRLAISKSVTLTSTYDHRIIQGAQSGEFLRQIHQLLLGEHGFWDEVFQALKIPYEPVRWVRDIPAGHEDDITKSARVHELIHAYRVRGHLMADTDPLEYKQRKHPDLDINQHGLTLWDLEREFATGGFGGKPLMKLREILGVLRDSYCRTVGVEYMHIQNPEERAWIQARVERPQDRAGHDEQMQILSRLNVAEAFEMFLQTKFVGQRRFSLEGAEALIPLVDAVLTEAAKASLDEAVMGMAHRGRLTCWPTSSGSPTPRSSRSSRATWTRAARTARVT